MQIRPLTASAKRCAPLTARSEYRDKTTKLTFEAFYDQKKSIRGLRHKTPSGRGEAPSQQQPQMYKIVEKDLGLSKRRLDPATIEDLKARDSQLTAEKVERRPTIMMTKAITSSTEEDESKALVSKIAEAQTLSVEEEDIFAKLLDIYPSRIAANALVEESTLTTTELSDSRNGLPSTSNDSIHSLTASATLKSDLVPEDFQNSLVAVTKAEASIHSLSASAFLKSDLKIEDVQIQNSLTSLPLALAGAIHPLSTPSPTNFLSASPGLLDFLDQLIALQTVKRQRQFGPPPKLRFLSFKSKSVAQRERNEESSEENMHRNTSSNKLRPRQIEREHFASRPSRQASGKKGEESHEAKMSIIYVPNLPHSNQEYMDTSTNQSQKIMFNGPPPPICPPIPHYPLPGSSDRFQQPQQPRKIPFQNFTGGREKILERVELIKEGQQRQIRERTSLDESNLFARGLSADQGVRRDEPLEQWRSKPSRDIPNNAPESSRLSSRSVDPTTPYHSSTTKPGVISSYLSTFRSSPVKTQDIAQNISKEDEKDNEVMDSFLMSPTLSGISFELTLLSASFDNLPSDLGIQRNRSKSSLKEAPLPRQKMFKNGSVGDVRRSQESARNSSSSSLVNSREVLASRSVSAEDKPDAGSEIEDGSGLRLRGGGTELSLEALYDQTLGWDERREDNEESGEEIESWLKRGRRLEQERVGHIKQTTLSNWLIDGEMSYFINQRTEEGWGWCWPNLDEFV